MTCYRTRKIAEFDDVQKSKIEELEGRILYNALETVEDKFIISHEASQILDESPSKLKGFYLKFYYPYGFHSNGSFESDSKDRENAKKLRALAADKAAYPKFSNALNDLANALDKSVETDL